MESREEVETTLDAEPLSTEIEPVDYENIEFSALPAPDSSPSVCNIAAL